MPKTLGRLLLLLILMVLPIQVLAVVPIEEMPEPHKSKIQKKLNSKKPKPKKLRLPKPEEVQQIDETPKDVIEVLYPEEFGQTVSTAVVGLANRIDSFFGDARSDDERNGSTLRIIPSYTLFSNQPAVTEMGVNLNLKLINLEEKARRFEKSIRNEILETTKIDEGLKSLRSPGGPGGSQQAREEVWHYNFESKLAARPAIYYSAKLRIRKNFVGDFFLHHFAVAGGWDTDDQWSQRTSLSSDHAINESLLFRFSNDADWFITRASFQTSHGPSLIHTINKYNSVAYNWRINGGLLNEEFHHLSTTYSANYRHGTPSKRIFVDLIPSYSYPRSWHYKEIRSFEIRFEYVFGNVD